MSCVAKSDSRILYDKAILFNKRQNQNRLVAAEQNNIVRNLFNYTTNFLWVCTNWCSDFPSITHLLTIIFNLTCSKERQLYLILSNLKSYGIFDDHLTTMFSSFDFGMLKLFSLIFSKILIVIYTLNPKLLTL